MAPKRPHDDDEVESGQHGSTGRGGADAAGSSMKRRKHAAQSNTKPKEQTTSWAKKRVRNIERLFQKGHDLPANVRNDLERELAAHRATISENIFQAKRSKMISKYHMVRFFEKRKAMRLAKQLKRKLEQTNDDEEKGRLSRELHIAEVDEAYTSNFPHAEPYISLYGGPKPDDDNEDEEGQQKSSGAKAALQSERPAMWSVVEKTMAEGPEALKRLRERRLPDGQAAPVPSKPQRPIQKKHAPQPRPMTDPKATSKEQDGSHPQLNRRERRRLLRENKGTMSNGGKAEAEDEDDGEGFFEEL